MSNLDVKSEVLWSNQLKVPTKLQTKFLNIADEVVQELERSSQATITFTREQIETELHTNFDELCEEIQNEPVDIEELGIDLRFTSENSKEKNPDDEIQAIYFFKPEEKN